MRMLALVLIVAALWILPVTIVLLLMKPAPAQVLVPVRYEKPPLTWLV